MDDPRPVHNIDFSNVIFHLDSGERLSVTPGGDHLTIRAVGESVAVRVHMPGDGSLEVRTRKQEQ